MQGVHVDGKLTMPVGNVFVGDAGCDVEHDDTALSVDVVSVTETTELLLTSRIPDIELNLSQVLHIKISIWSFSSGS
jgi:hypothetical protein